MTYGGALALTACVLLGLIIICIVFSAIFWEENRKAAKGLLWVALMVFCVCLSLWIAAIWSGVK